MPPCTWSSGGRPTRCARAVELAPAPLLAPHAAAVGRAPRAAAPRAVRGQPRAHRVDGGSPRSPIGSTCGTSVAHGPLLELGRQRGRHREDVRDHHVGVERADQPRRLRARPRTAAWYGFSGRSRVGKTSYSGAGREAHALALDVLAPALPGLQRTRRGRGAASSRPARSPGTRGPGRRRRRAGSACALLRSGQSPPARAPSACAPRRRRPAARTISVPTPASR